MCAAAMTRRGHSANNAGMKNCSYTSAALPLTLRAGAGAENVTIEGDGVTLNDGMVKGVTIAAGSALLVQGSGWVGFGTPGGLSETINGEGEIRLAGTLRAYNTYVTIGPDITVTGGGTVSGDSIVNQGTILGGITIDTGITALMGIFTLPMPSTEVSTVVSIGRLSEIGI